MRPLTDVSPVRRNFFRSADSVDSLVTGATLGDEICVTKINPDEDLMADECRLDDANADGLDSDVESSLADDLDALLSEEVVDEDRAKIEDDVQDYDDRLIEGCPDGWEPPSEEEGFVPNALKEAL